MTIGFVGNPDSGSLRAFGRLSRWLSGSKTGKPPAPKARRE